MSLATFLSKWFRRGRPAAAAGRPRRRPSVEALEDRCLLAIGVAAFLPQTASWHIRHSASAGPAEITPFAFGGAALTPLAGDFDGDGTDSVAAFDPASATFYLRDSNTAGVADAFAFGAPGWLAVAGDWDADGRDSVGVFDPTSATFYLRNSNAAGAPDVTPFRFGLAGWAPVVGDWDGDGRDGVGVFDPASATFYLRNDTSSGGTDAGAFRFGGSGWSALAGDWDGDGRDSVGVVSAEGVWYLRNSNAAGAPDVAPFAYGGPGAVALAMTTAPQSVTTPTPVVVSPTPAPQPPAAPAAQPPAQSAQQPSLGLTLPAAADGTEFTATLTVSGAGASGFAAFGLDVDLDHDGAFDSDGEAGYVELLPGAEPATSAALTARGLIHGTYKVRGHALDPALGELVSEVKQVELKRPASRYLPLAYEQNLGQTDAQVQYLARSSDFVAFLTGQGLVLSGQAPAAEGSEGPSDVVVEMRWGKGTDGIQGQAEGALDGKSNYFIGNDQSQWIKDVPNYARVRYGDVWQGVDVVYAAEGGRLRWDFEVKPGGHAGAVSLWFPHLADPLEIDGEGRLVVHTGGATVVQAAPVAYQDRADGTRVAVPSQWRLLGSDLVGFEVGAYDPTRTLVIDPYIYNTFLGGSGNEQGFGIAADSSGNAYVTGRTQSSNFPTTGPITNGGSNQGQVDVIVAKLNSSGTARVYSTYIGGGGDDRGFAITLDGAGNAYITGDTNSSNYPTTTGVFQTTRGGQIDAFLSKLNSAGNALVYSTYHGGGADEHGVAIALDTSGSAYITGDGDSTNMPTTTGAFQTTAPGGSTSGFVVKINGDATARVYSTYLGGSGDDRGFGIAVDGAGSAYVTGRTDSNNYPTVTPFQGTRGGQDDAFITKLNAAGTGLTFSSYLGGGGDDRGFAIDLDASNNAYITGETSSNGLGTSGVFQVARNGMFDAFVTEVNAAGSGLTYFTYLGGSGDDRGNGIAVDASGNANVAGRTASNNFPTQSPLQSNSLNADAFVTVLNAAATALTFSTYLGGNGSETANAIALDGSNNIYVVGTSDSNTSFPNTAGVVQTTNAGGDDLFIAKIQAPTGGGGGGGGGTTIAGDVFEANNTSDVATDFGALTATQTFNSLTINITAAGLYDQDWYRWTAGASGTFNVALTGISAATTAVSASGATGQIHLRVFRLDGASQTLTELGSSRAIGAAQAFQFGVSAGDVLYVWAFGYDFSVGTYNMAANVV